MEACGASPVGRNLAGSGRIRSGSHLVGPAHRRPRHRGRAPTSYARRAARKRTSTKPASVRRRIRSHLRTFRTVVDPIWASVVRAELGWFGGLLGDVRNFDVMAGRIKKRADEGEDLVGYKELLAMVDQGRAAVRESSPRRTNSPLSVGPTPDRRPRQPPGAARPRRVRRGRIGVPAHHAAALPSFAAGGEDRPAFTDRDAPTRAAHPRKSSATCQRSPPR